MSGAVAELCLCERARAVSLCRTHSTRLGVLFVVGPIGFVFSISPLFLSRIAWAFSIIVIIFTWFRFFLCSKFSAVGLCSGGGRRERNERRREKSRFCFSELVVYVIYWLKSVCMMHVYLFIAVAFCLLGLVFVSARRLLRIVFFANCSRKAKWKIQSDIRWI